MNWPLVYSLVVGPVFLLFGLAGLGCASAVMRRGKRSRQWPQVDGRIVAVRVEKTAVDAGWTYRAKIEYEYEVEGTTYRSARRRFGDFMFMPNRRNEENIARKYQEAKTVRVSYDPTNPQDAVLEPGICTKRLLALLVGGAVGLYIGATALLGVFFKAGS